jgi:hypothetical protein
MLPRDPFLIPDESNNDVSYDNVLSTINTTMMNSNEHTSANANANPKERTALCSQDGNILTVTLPRSNHIMETSNADKIQPPSHLSEPPQQLSIAAEETNETDCKSSSRLIDAPVESSEPKVRFVPLIFAAHIF